MAIVNCIANLIGEMNQRVAGAMFPPEAILMLIKMAIIIKIIHSLKTHDFSKLERIEIGR